MRLFSTDWFMAWSPARAVRGRVGHGAAAPAKAARIWPMVAERWGSLVANLQFDRFGGFATTKAPIDARRFQGMGETLYRRICRCLAPSVTLHLIQLPPRFPRKNQVSSRRAVGNVVAVRQEQNFPAPSDRTRNSGGGFRHRCCGEGRRQPPGSAKCRSRSINNCSCHGFADGMSHTGSSGRLRRPLAWRWLSYDDGRRTMTRRTPSSRGWPASLATIHLGIWQSK